MADLFDAAAMYDEDYLYFFASSGAAAPTHGPVVGTAYTSVSALTSSGGCWISGPAWTGRFDRV